MIILDVTIPIKIKSANRTIYRKGDGAFWQYKAYKTACRMVVTGFCKQPDKPTTVKIHAEFVRLIGCHGREMDKDNLYTASKPVRDALKSLGWIKDDSPAWLDYNCSQTKSADGTHGLRIILAEGA